VSLKKLLLDENLPHNLRRLLGTHKVFTVAFLGWAGIQNGDLLDAADREGFDVLITSDQGFSHQQRMDGRRLGVLLLPTPDWNVLKDQAPAILQAIQRVSPGTVVHVLISAP
jgi:predicted nuclease of predicted toxin-antitoxin system